MRPSPNVSGRWRPGSIHNATWRGTWPRRRRRRWRRDTAPERSPRGILKIVDPRAAASTAAAIAAASAARPPCAASAWLPRRWLAVDCGLGFSHRGAPPGSLCRGGGHRNAADTRARSRLWRSISACGRCARGGAPSTTTAGGCRAGPPGEAAPSVTLSPPLPAAASVARSLGFAHAALDAIAAASTTAAAR